MGHWGEDFEGDKVSAGQQLGGGSASSKGLVDSEVGLIHGCLLWCHGHVLGQTRVGKVLSTKSQVLQECTAGESGGEAVAGGSLLSGTFSGATPSPHGSLLSEPRMLCHILYSVTHEPSAI